MNTWTVHMHALTLNIESATLEVKTFASESLALKDICLFEPDSKLTFHLQLYPSWMEHFLLVQV